MSGENINSKCMVCDYCDCQVYYYFIFYVRLHLKGSVPVISSFPDHSLRQVKAAFTTEVLLFGIAFLHKQKSVNSEIF